MAKKLLHAGSLYKNYLVLYTNNATKDSYCVIQVDDKDLQWDIYCNKVEFESVDALTANITFDGKIHKVNYIVTDNPMKTLGFI